jgi:chromosome segregation ATPase
MTNASKARRMLAIGAMTVGLAVTASGQAPSKPTMPDRTVFDDLLAEVRALRADLDRATATSMRGQLLAMRLQLQEQRLATLSRQLSDVQQQIRANVQTRATLAASLKMLAGAKDESGQVAKEFEAMLKPLKQQLTGLDNADAQLKNEEASLTSQLQAEQARWSTFNAQIEEIERAAVSKSVR